MTRIWLEDTRALQCHVRAEWSGSTSIAHASLTMRRGVVTDVDLTWHHGEPPHDVVEAVIECLRADVPHEVKTFADYETFEEMTKEIEKRVGRSAA